MAEMDHPFQCLEAVTKWPSGGQQTHICILAACGPKLVSLSAESGEIVSQWSADVSNEKSQPGVNTNENDDEAEQRPAKTQKVSSSLKNLPIIIKLAITPDNQHAVVVTDDKCLRVFAIADDGKIAELSQRFMPKRPCAVQVLPDNSTILCGDKFGDVYSLPLLPKEPELEAESSAALKDANEVNESTSQLSSFKPSASTTTVHTKRNLKSLEAQLKQKNLTPKTKEPLKFEHKLLLGHVSMLTDLCYATKEIDSKQRGFIITADRDEHIRVTRGPPQSHIIEGFCLGHTSFVSKILVIPGSNLMISGGGDDWLGVWDWPSFTLRRKIHGFGKRVLKAETLTPDLRSNQDAYPVSGMWLIRGIEFDEDLLAVACEKSSVLSWFRVSELLQPPDNPQIHWVTEAMGDPILDLTQMGEGVLVSHCATRPTSPRIAALPLGGARSSEGYVLAHRVIDDLQKLLQPLLQVQYSVGSVESLNGFLYTVESLRKRTYKDRDEEDGEE